MSICPLTYLECNGKYSKQGLKKLSRNLTTLDDLPYTAAEQIREAAARALKISIQGVQPKLSAILSSKRHRFEVVDKGGRYILKPQNPQFLQLPENEDLSMRLAAIAGIIVPQHGLIYSKDNSMTYFIKRFDRVGRNSKVAVEDFSQLSGRTRNTKYDSSVEKTVAIIDRFCTFPALERIKLFQLTVVNFLLGNEDMHLKNFSLIINSGKVELSPAYDLVNTTIVLSNPKEEIALPLKGKKRNINGQLLVSYLGIERLNLSKRVILNTLQRILNALPEWDRLIGISFLSDDLKKVYKELVLKRKEALFKGMPTKLKDQLKYERETSDC
jgi:serine/threonine-protein kinase HipA